MKNSARGLSIASLFVSCAAFCAYAGYFQMFSSFSPYDDEGYMLVSLQAFRQGHVLYDQVFSQYGPAYFHVMGGVFDVLGLAVTHDNGRFVTLGLWVATALFSGVVTWRLTGSFVFGLCVQMVVFGSLHVNCNEPMHPGGLISLLLVMVTAIPLLFVKSHAWASFSLGAAVAALALIKINSGFFVFLSVALFALAAYPFGSRHSERRGLAVAFTVATMGAVPIVLMWPLLGQQWVVRYLLFSVAAILSASIMSARCAKDERTPPPCPIFIVGGMAGVCILCFTATVLLGTSPKSLIEAVLIRPFLQSDAYCFPLEIPSSALIGSFASLSLCCLVVARGWRGQILSNKGWVGALRVVAGIAILKLGFSSAPLVWLAAWSPPVQENSRPALLVARRLLPAMAALQILTAFPVASSQIQWGSLLTFPLGAIILADGTRQIRHSVGWNKLSSRVRRSLAPGLALCVVGVILFDTLRTHIAHWQHYQSGAALDLPGASHIRLPETQSGELRRLSRDLMQTNSTFISLPGLNSFYLWAGKEPPTSWNATGWMFLFDSETQMRIVDQLKKTKNLCGLYNDVLVQFWCSGRPAPRGPLVDYFFRELVPVRRYGDYFVFERPPTSLPGRP